MDNNDEKPKGLGSRMDGVEDKLEDIHKYFNAPQRTLMDKLTGKKKVGKEYKLPNKIRAVGKKKIKENYVLLIYVRTNGNIEMGFAPINNDLVYVKQTGLYHAANAKYIMRYQKYPAMIVLEYSLIPINSEEQKFTSEPLNLEEHYIEAEKKGEISFPQKVVIAATKAAQMGSPMQFQGKTLLWIGIIAIVLLYLLSTMLNN